MTYHLIPKLKEIFLILAFVLLSAGGVLAQEDSVGTGRDKDFKRNVKLGLNYHLQLHHIDVAPVAFYRLNNRVDAGVGVNYLYYYTKDEFKNTSAYGTNIFTRVYFLQNFFLHLEYLYCNVPYRNNLNFEYSRVYVTSFFSGIGYRQPVTSKVDTYLLGLVDLTHRDESPYKNLVVVKFGVSF